MKYPQVPFREAKQPGVEGLYFSLPLLLTAQYIILAEGINDYENKTAKDSSEVKKHFGPSFFGFKVYNWIHASSLSKCLHN